MATETATDEERFLEEITKPVQYGNFTGDTEVIPFPPALVLLGPNTLMCVPWYDDEIDDSYLLPVNPAIDKEQPTDLYCLFVTDHPLKLDEREALAENGVPAETLEKIDVLLEAFCINWAHRNG